MKNIKTRESHLKIYGMLSRQYGKTPSNLIDIVRNSPVPMGEVASSHKSFTVLACQLSSIKYSAAILSQIFQHPRMANATLKVWGKKNGTLSPLCISSNIHPSSKNEL